jgi:hypothetical protein
MQHDYLLRNKQEAKVQSLHIVRKETGKQTCIIFYHRILI